MMNFRILLFSGLLLGLISCGEKSLKRHPTYLKHLLRSSLLTNLPLTWQPCKCKNGKLLT